ncbi:hypothetical protein COB64_02590 [Candidatus Wolfebacteria bacterium]|nr:MAG: hypothetical protein COB64_02590 [Candidatus Wolfebacteria bacterium]
MYVKVRIISGSKKEYIVKKGSSLTRLHLDFLGRNTVKKISASEDTYEVAVKLKTERNMANKRLIEMMASELCIPQKNIRIISGHHSRSKILSVHVI